MVLDEAGNLALIDVGRGGGVTHEWLSPEMQQALETRSASFRARKENDIWAAGRALYKMADAQEQKDGGQELLRSAAEGAMGHPAQVSLSRIAGHLSGSPIVETTVTCL